MTTQQKMELRADLERRKARRLSFMVVGFTLAFVAFVLFTDVGAGKSRKPRVLAHSAAYNHIDVCKSTLRGYSSDDDINRVGVQTGAKSFGGWGASGHYADGSAFVWGAFNFSYGQVTWYRGRCSGGDYASDWFANS